MTGPPPAAPYESPLDHFVDHGELCRLLLTRHIARHWFRLTNEHGQIEQTRVSFEEVRRTIVAEGFAFDPIPDSELEAVGLAEARLAAHREHMAARLRASAERYVSLPIEDLRAAFDLGPRELDALVLLAVLQTNPRLTRLGAFARGDLSDKEPTLAFVAEVVAGGAEDFAVVARLGHPSHRLARLRVIELRDAEIWRGRTPDLMRYVRLSDRLASFILGQPAALEQTSGPIAEHDDLDRFCRVYHGAVSMEDIGQPPDLAGRLVESIRQAHRYAADRVAGAEVGLARATPLLVLSGQASGHRELARACLMGNCPLLEVQLSAGLPEKPTLDQLESRLGLALREAILLEALPLLVLDDLVERAPEPLTTALSRTLPCFQGLVVISAERPGRALRTALGPCAELVVHVPSWDRRTALWSRAIEAHQPLDEPMRGALVNIAQRYALMATEIREAADHAAFEARARSTRRRDAAITPGDVQRAVTARIQHELEALAVPYSTRLTWDDVVLPDDLKERLFEMMDYARHRRRVYDDWGLGRLVSYGQGLTALFHGPPGTGKTLAAGIFARELRADLYRVDLSRVVSKWIGETEKNLARIFREAERSRAILLFDEADSLFAQRTSVQSSNDRNANLEVNYLLQRIEHFAGTTILTTNFYDSIDDAFKRRIRFRLHFPAPTPEQRKLVWQKMLPPGMPVAADLDLDSVATRYEMTPGHIKNAVTRAAFEAARRECPVTTEMLRDAARIEYKELGHLVREPTG